MRQYIIAFCFAILPISFLSSQNIVKMSAIKSNDYGVAYRLPKTEIVIRATYTKTTRKVGEFYRFAERYLSVNNPIVEDQILYKLVNIEAITKGVTDNENSYLVEFKSNSVAPFVMLTKDGVICSINAEVADPQDVKFASIENESVSKASNPRSYLSEEVLRAGSSAKQAELIAKQIYRLRESKTNILTGEADNMPPDGDSYKLVMNQIDEQEKALTSMFIGTETVETLTREFSIIPTNDNIEKRVLFRFSSKLGVVDANNLAGAPVYLSLISNSKPKQNVELTAKEQKAWEEKFSKGIIYNVPTKAKLQIEFDGHQFVQKEIDVVQFGEREVLVPRQLESKNPVQVIFYPDLGAIKEIK